MTEEAAEIDVVADLLADGRDDTNRSGLLVDHAEGCLVCDDTGDRGRRRVARDGDHIEADGAYAGHRLELLDVESTGLDGIDHTLILGNRDERAAESADGAGRHDTALLHLIVQHRQCGGRARRTGALESHRLQDIRNRITDGRRRCEGEVNDAERNTELTARLLRYQLAYAGDLKRGLLDQFGQLLEIEVLRVLQCITYDARSGDADVQDAVCLGNAMEGTGHERVIIRCVTEND